MIAYTAHAWALKRQDGLTLGFTEHDAELRFEGISFRPERGLSARALVQAVGLSVDNSEVEGALSDEAISASDLAAGRWDGAELRLWQVDWQNPARRQLLFCGHLGQITRSAGLFRAELRGLSEALSASNGRSFQRQCGASFGDSACGLDLGDPALRGAAWVQGVDGREITLAGAGGYSDGWFSGGVIEVKTGQVAGLRGMISFDQLLPDGLRRVWLWQEFEARLQASDQVEMVAGCDRAAETCRAKFRNYLNFRGFPHLPGDDWIMAPQIGGSDD